MFGERVYNERWWTTSKVKEYNLAVKLNYQTSIIPNAVVYKYKIFCNAADLIEIQQGAINEY